MRSLLATIVVFTFLICSAIAMQQDTGTYRLRPEDVLHIQIYNEPQVNSEVPIARDGNISAPFVGILRAEGKTTAELADQLYVLYQKVLRLKDPKVSVTVSQFRPLRATIGGAVLRPGTYTFRNGDSVLSLFDQGGGASQDAADLRRATLRHAGSKELTPLDILAIQNGTDPGQNYELQDGDEISVPENRRNRIIVQGQVVHPGLFPYHEPMRIADAISLAGGEIPTRSKFSQTVVLRELTGQPGQYLLIHVDYVRFIRRNDFSQNIDLQPGDIVYVPETNTPDLNRIGNFINSYFILNSVLTRGIFGIRFPGL